MVVTNKKKKQELWWKRRVKQSIEEIRKHINILQQKMSSEKMQRMQRTEIEK